MSIKFTNQVKVRANSELGSLSSVVGNQLIRPTEKQVQSGISTDNKNLAAELALFDNFFSAPVQNSQSFHFLGYGANQQDTQLAGLMSEGEKSLYRFYRDIYNYDAVAGSMVDLMSTMPFSDFSLSDCTEEEGNVHLRALNHLNIKDYLSEIVKDYYITGKFCGSLVYSREKKLFADFMIHQAEDMTVKPMPFVNMEPLIEVSQSEYVRDLLIAAQSHPNIQSYLSSLPSSFVQAIKAEAMILDPETTVFIPRRIKAGPTEGQSIYRRVLPIYLLEKTLYRGTLVQASRRQGSVLHAQVGDGTTWMPSPQELQAVATLIQQADLDPLSPTVVTRNGVNVSEFRQGGDFWKWTDLIEITNAQKLRALGISEAFLSSDTSYASMETSLSVFLEGLSSLRDKITHSLFYSKIFPLISLVNSQFVRSETADTQGYADAVHTQAYKNSNNRNDSKISRYLADKQKIVIPKINWFKQLKPQANRDYMDILVSLQENGVPVPLRVMAAAGGLDLDSLANDLSQETHSLDKIYKAKQERQKVIDKYSGENSSGGGNTDDPFADPAAENEFDSSDQVEVLPVDKQDPNIDKEATKELQEENKEENKEESPKPEVKENSSPDSNSMEELELSVPENESQPVVEPLGFNVVEEYKGVPWKIPDNAKIEVSSPTFKFKSPKVKSNPFEGRNFEEFSELIGKTKTGKPKYILNQKSLNEKMNENASKALKALSDPSVFNKALARKK